MTRRDRGPIAVALAVAIALTLALATVGAMRATAAQGYWEAGFYRLLLDEVWRRWDRLIGPGLATLVPAALLARRARRLPVRSAVVFVGAVVALRLLTLADAYRPGPPNLLLISIDTLRADHLGAYGQALPTSPTIDARLAAEGVTFEDVYSQSPKTTPSHMTLLTSLYPCAHGVNLWVAGEPGRVLSPAANTLAEILKNAGYATAAFTGGAQMDHTRGFDQGFDLYEDGGGQVGHSLRWIKHHRHQRFFVFFHTYDVHDPYVPPARLVERFGEGYDGRILAAVDRLRDGGGEWEDRHRQFWDSVDATDPADVRFVERLYDAGIRNLDAQTITTILDRLDALHLTRRTLVVFTADHGEAFNEHGRFLHDDLHAGTLRVPLILRLPGVLPPGRRVPDRVGLVDVVPTVLDLLGVPRAASLQGRSLLPLVDRGDAAPVDTISEYTTTGRRFESVRRGTLAFIADRGRETLFDLAADPGEHVDRAAERPADAASMRGVLTAWRERCRDAAARFGPRGDGVMPDAETSRKLRALGYLE